LYSDEFYGQYLRAENSPKELDRLLRKHPVRWALTAYDGYARLLQKNVDYQLVYFDDQYLIYANLRDEVAAGFAHKHAFRFISPPQLLSLVNLRGPDLVLAKQEFERQRKQCADCIWTQTAALALAVADGDDPAFMTVQNRIISGLVQNEPAEIPCIGAIHAERRGRTDVASNLWHRCEQLGGQEYVDIARRAVR
jgi:hypothetical protein